jgi:hypothetical protein
MQCVRCADSQNRRPDPIDCCPSFPGAVIDGVSFVDCVFRGIRSTEVVDEHSDPVDVADHRRIVLSCPFMFGSGPTIRRLPTTPVMNFG